MRKVMIRAWEIAREAAKRFDGKIKEYFQQALIMAWAEVKSVKLTIAAVKELAHTAMTDTDAADYELNKWNKEGYNRIYINLVNYRKHKKVITDCGYLDLNNMEYVADSKFSIHVYDLVAKEVIDSRRESNKYVLEA